VQKPPGQDHRSDTELVRCANRGGAPAADAFESLYRRHRTWVLNTAYRFTQDRDSALDVMQDVFMYLLGKFPGFVLTAKFTTFLYPVIKHTAQQARRKADRSAPGSPEELLDELPAPQTANTGGIAADNSGGGGDDIDRILAGLPAHQREVLLLRFVDGMTIGEVALTLGVPVGTVKSRIHLAIRSLREDPAVKKYFQE
jgi:RNA polymerase sigma-70 factor, ECF subfamily